MLANARLLDVHRMAALLRGESTEAVVAALRAYRNTDGGFGHALEPDVRAPDSEPTSTLHALSVLAEIGALEDPMAVDAAAWIERVANPDGGVPFVLPTAAAYPGAPWMVPSEDGSHLTFALAAVLLEAEIDAAWLDRGREWCWSKLESPDELSAYSIKFSLEFLDRVEDSERAETMIEGMRGLLDADGSVRVAGGTDDERLTPLTLSERPDARSRALFTPSQIEAGLDQLELGQQDDGGWTFDWLAWSPGQSIEWRGALTVRALSTLIGHGRIEAHSAIGGSDHDLYEQVQQPFPQGAVGRGATDERIEGASSKAGQRAGREGEAKP